MMLMAAVANAMLVVAHPVLQSGGRALTVFFSPTRCKMPSVCKAQEKPNLCVCCKRRLSVKRKNIKEYETGVDPIQEADMELEDLLESVEKTIERPQEVVNSIEPTKKRARLSSQKLRGRYSRFETEETKNDSEYEESDDELDGDHQLDLDGLDSEKEDEEYEEEIDEEDILSDEEEEEDNDENRTKSRALGRGRIIPIPESKCRTASMGARHFACESCLESIQECPKCKELDGRLKNRLPPESSDAPMTEDLDAGEMKEGLERVFCPEIFGGFRASTKLKAIVASFNEIPCNEKALVVSFYKGGLDLLERMFIDLYPNMKVARFDGDVGVEERERALEEFKSTPSCRVLLMTVKTGGVGLNLVEANHVLFLDRNCKWLCLLCPLKYLFLKLVLQKCFEIDREPHGDVSYKTDYNRQIFFVLGYALLSDTLIGLQFKICREQCEDRCYRIGQKKKVSVVYHDTKGTIDQAMGE